MKAKVISLAIALVALLGFSSAFAQNPKWTFGPSYVAGGWQPDWLPVIEGMATGLGTGPLYMKITGQYDCVNRGDNTSESGNWSDLEIIVPVEYKKTGGNFKLSATLNMCPKAEWTTYLQLVVVTLYDNPSASGTPIIGPTIATPIKL